MVHFDFQISSGDSEDVDWSDEDEMCSLVSPVAYHVPVITPPTCELSSSGSKISDRFLEMGYPLKVVFRAIEEHGENDEEAILNAILTYLALETLPGEDNHVTSDPHLSDSASTYIEDLSDMNSILESQGQNKYFETMNLLEDMGFSYDEAFAAINRCGCETPIDELVEFIDAANMAKADDLQGLNDIEQLRYGKKQKLDRDERWTYSVKNMQLMIGFGVPNSGMKTVDREIPAAGKGPPYFYYENVAYTPKGVWENMSRFLYEIEPEFVDSMHFSAAARKRGYIHNLPIDGRFPLLPIPPFTIQEALPLTNKWWPKWDQRTKLNCILIRHGSAEDTKKIKEELDKSGPDPPEHVRKYVLEQCRRYNFVWVGKNKVAPLDPDEIEVIMGYSKYHTRGGGISTTARYQCLGNSFQVDTVAYHLSVLKKLFPNGIKVLSLFSGIGGAEVALHKLGIPLKFVVSVESSETCRNILQSWWEQSNQKGKLIHIFDVRDVTLGKLKELMDMTEGFDLVIGGSPCNNLAGRNRYTRDGLYGDQSSLFFDYFRILDLVKKITVYRAYA
ncbi:DNA (cytosine-5)-methyltransferase DRM2 isoform X1 [Daucus carota subsp. sativus]|uniref:DNA (cytosine-5)-methyltransferase DRM2 isoform X1 n=1 Tax=Daucus carota subsp. sativus TaxID=79200 RepID=UPI0007EF9BAD|nr:PREDICTED: DNA (cytosine-5)-methyltransferase DRM2-like isoform X1 [Daucus carota subsp. sativus]